MKIKFSEDFISRKFRTDDQLVLKLRDTSGNLSDFDAVWDADKGTLKIYDEYDPNSLNVWRKSSFRINSQIQVCSIDGDTIFSIIPESDLNPNEPINRIFEIQLDFRDENNNKQYPDIVVSNTEDIEYLESKGVFVPENIFSVIMESTSAYDITKISTRDSWYRYIRVNREGDFRVDRGLDVFGKNIEPKIVYREYSDLFLYCKESSIVYPIYRYKDSGFVSFYGTAIETIYEEQDGEIKVLGKSLVSIQNVSNVEIEKVGDILKDSVVIDNFRFGVDLGDNFQRASFQAVAYFGERKITSNTLTIISSDIDNILRISRIDGQSRSIFEEDGLPLIMFQGINDGVGLIKHDIEVETTFEEIDESKLVLTFPKSWFKIEKTIESSRILLHLENIRTPSTSTDWGPKDGYGNPIVCEIKYADHYIAKFYMVVLPNNNIRVNTEGTHADQESFTRIGINNASNVISKSIYDYGDQLTSDHHWGILNSGLDEKIKLYDNSGSSSSSGFPISDQTLYPTNSSGYDYRPAADFYMWSEELISNYYTGSELKGNLYIYFRPPGRPPIEESDGIYNWREFAKNSSINTSPENAVFSHIFPVWYVPSNPQIELWSETQKKYLSTYSGAGESDLSILEDSVYQYVDGILGNVSYLSPCYCGLGLVRISISTDVYTGPLSISLSGTGHENFLKIMSYPESLYGGATGYMTLLISALPSTGYKEFSLIVTAYGHQHQMTIYLLPPPNLSSQVKVFEYRRLTSYYIITGIIHWSETTESEYEEMTDWEQKKVLLFEEIPEPTTTSSGRWVSIRENLNKIKLELFSTSESTNCEVVLKDPSLGNPLLIRRSGRVCESAFCIKLYDVKFYIDPGAEYLLDFPQPPQAAVKVMVGNRLADSYFFYRIPRNPYKDAIQFPTKIYLKSYSSTLNNINISFTQNYFRFPGRSDISKYNKMPNQVLAWSTREDNSLWGLPWSAVSHSYDERIIEGIPVYLRRQDDTNTFDMYLYFDDTGINEYVGYVTGSSESIHFLMMAGGSTNSGAWSAQDSLVHILVGPQAPATWHHPSATEISRSSFNTTTMTASGFLFPIYYDSSNSQFSITLQNASQFTTARTDVYMFTDRAYQTPANNWLRIWVKGAYSSCGFSLMACFGQRHSTVLLGSSLTNLSSFGARELWYSNRLGKGKSVLAYNISGFDIVDNSATFRVSLNSYYGTDDNDHKFPYLDSTNDYQFGTFDIQCPIDDIKLFSSSLSDYEFAESAGVSSTNIRNIVLTDPPYAYPIPEEYSSGGPADSPSSSVALSGDTLVKTIPSIKVQKLGVQEYSGMASIPSKTTIKYSDIEPNPNNNIVERGYIAKRFQVWYRNGSDDESDIFSIVSDIYDTKEISLAINEAGVNTEFYINSLNPLDDNHLGVAIYPRGSVQNALEGVSYNYSLTKLYHKSSSDYGISVNMPSALTSMFSSLESYVINIADTDDSPVSLDSLLNPLETRVRIGVKSGTSLTIEDILTITRTPLEYLLVYKNNNISYFCFYNGEDPDNLEKYTINLGTLPFSESTKEFVLNLEETSTIQSKISNNSYNNENYPVFWPYVGSPVNGQGPYSDITILADYYRVGGSVNSEDISPELLESLESEKWDGARIISPYFNGKLRVSLPENQTSDVITWIADVSYKKSFVIGAGTEDEITESKIISRAILLIKQDDPRGSVTFNSGLSRIYSWGRGEIKFNTNIPRNNIEIYLNNELLDNDEYSLINQYSGNYLLFFDVPENHSLSKRSYNVEVRNKYYHGPIKHDTNFYQGCFGMYMCRVGSTTPILINNSETPNRYEVPGYTHDFSNGFLMSYYWNEDNDENGMPVGNNNYNNFKIWYVDRGDLVITSTRDNSYFDEIETKIVYRYVQGNDPLGLNRNYDTRLQTVYRFKEGYIEQELDFDEKVNLEFSYPTEAIFTSPNGIDYDIRDKRIKTGINIKYRKLASDIKDAQFDNN